MTVLGIQHHHGDIVGNALIVFLGIGIGDISRATNHIKHRLVKVLQVLFRCTHHFHVTDTCVQHHACLDTGIISHA